MQQNSYKIASKLERNEILEKKTPNREFILFERPFKRSSL